MDTFFNHHFWIRRGSIFILQRIGSVNQYIPSYIYSLFFLVRNCAIFMVWTVDDSKGYTYRCVYDVSCVGAEKNESKNNIRNLKRGLERTRVIEIKFDDSLNLFYNNFFYKLYLAFNLIIYFYKGSL